MGSLEPTVGKRIALPMRIEPKVFFANERTFLSWLHFTVVLGGLAMGLLNFGDKISQLCALMFTLIAMGVMVYALYTYHWRANKIRNRLDASYDDRWGPSVLCIFLLAAVLLNLFCNTCIWQKEFIKKKRKENR
ncbi:vacuolar transporter chaperone 1 [Absidia repens]|uniref:Vacuolar transporter chaperone 1 n=1 Tax=Absidia repens TaxID=90262 RepID=A0A1X2IPU0_9FUNG|nr:vacuolar transporter chaperone 1 [Absidia repens]